MQSLRTVNQPTQCNTHRSQGKRFSGKRIKLSQEKRVISDRKKILPKKLTTKIQTTIGDERWTEYGMPFLYVQNIQPKAYNARTGSQCQCQCNADTRVKVVKAASPESKLNSISLSPSKNRLGGPITLQIMYVFGFWDDHWVLTDMMKWHPRGTPQKPFNNKVFILYLSNNNYTNISLAEVFVDSF